MKIINSGARVCHNLMPDSITASLTAAPLPQAVAHRRWQAAATFPSGRSLLYDGSYLCLYDPDDGAGTPVACGTAYKSFHLLDNRVAAMTDTGVVFIDEANLSGTPAPAVSGDKVCCRFVVSEAANVSAMVGAVPLTRAYGTREVLTMSDRSRLVDACADGLRRLDLNARGEGLFIAPVLARVRFLRADGSTAFETNPVLLQHPAGKVVEATRSLKTSGPDAKQTLVSEFETPAWRVRLQIDPDSALAAQVTAAQVLLSPAFHNVNPDGRPLVTAAVPSANIFVSMTFPEGPAGRGPGLVRAVTAAASQPQLWGYVAATVVRPFTAGCDVVITPPAHIDMAGHAAGLRPIVRSAHTAPDCRTALLRPPHTFTASVSASASGVTVWGNIDVVRFNGYRPDSFATRFADEAWEGYVRVDFGDGTRSVVSTARGTSMAPVLFQPHLSYPSPDAVSMTIAVRRGGVCYGRKVPLTADPGGMSASYTNAAAVPFTLEPAASYAVPAHGSLLQPMPGTVACALTDDPLTLTAHAAHEQSELCAITPARVGESSWDFGRVRFYAFGSRGISSVAVGATRRNVSVSLLDSRPCRGRRAFAVTPEGVAALAGGDVVRVCGSRVNTLLCAEGYAALAYDPVRHEIWCLPPAGGAKAGSALVLCRRTADGCYTRTADVDTDRLHPHAESALLPGPDGLMDIRRPDMATAVDIRYNAPMEPPAGKRRPMRLRVPVAGTAMQLTVGLSRDRSDARMEFGNGGVRISGTLRHGLDLPVLPVFAACSSFELRGTVYPDFHLETPVMS